MFPTVQHKEFPCAQGNTIPIPLRFFINFCTLNNTFSSQLRLYHTHTHIYAHKYTNTSLKVPFSFLNFCLLNEELGNLNNLKYLNKCYKNTSEKKGQIENRYKQLEFKHVPFTFINVFVFSNLHSEIQTTAQAMDA